MVVRDPASSGAPRPSRGLSKPVDPRAVRDRHRQQLWCAFPVTTAEDNPSYEQAMRGPEKQLWEEACEAEIENLVQFRAFQLVREDEVPDWDYIRRRAPSVTETLWVLRRKYNSKGEISKYKARCVYNNKRRANSSLIETFCIHPPCATPRSRPLSRCRCCWGASVPDSTLPVHTCRASTPRTRSCTPDRPRGTVRCRMTASPSYGA